MTLDRAILRSASWLVPAPQRAEWLAEWSAELCYVTHGATRFCLGAYRDALWLRRNLRVPAQSRISALESPLVCLLLLITLAAGSALLALRLPFARGLLLPSRGTHWDRLAVLGADRPWSDQPPGFTMARYRVLAAHRPAAFTALAIYRPAGAGVAVASRNWFDVLGTASGGWRLPGSPTTWRLEDANWFDALPSDTKVFVIAQLREPAKGRWQIPISGGPGEQSRVQCLSLAQEQPVWAWLVMVLTSLLTLASTNHLRLGEYPARRHALRRWFFLAVKGALVLAIIACGSLDVASLTSPGLYPTLWLVGLVLGLRWAVVDQRRRCPECLRLLSHPTRIGGPSQVFLEWYGTELVCGRGHGLLYVPEIVTSCYSTQRWQYLDASWSGLFQLERAKM